MTATVFRDRIKWTFCTSARSLGDREVVFISVGLQCAVPIASKGKNSVFSPCLTLIKPSTLCTHHLFQETLFSHSLSCYTNIALHFLAHLLVYLRTHNRQICHLCSEACSSVLQPSTLQKSYLQGGWVRSALRLEGVRLPRCW